MFPSIGGISHISQTVPLAFELYPTNPGVGQNLASRRGVLDP